MTHIDRRSISLLGLAAILSPTAALAEQPYPSRPIHLIVGFTAGATSDVIARIFAKAADPLLGQQVVVENKPGAGSSIAAEYVRDCHGRLSISLPAQRRSDASAGIRCRAGQARL